MVLQQAGVGAEALFSTLGRTAARGIETLVVAEQFVPWLDELAAHMGDGDLNVFNGEKWDPATWPKTARGWGHHEAPRGALGHWIQIVDQKVGQLPGSGSLDLERLSARREGAARSLRSGPGGHAGGRPGAAH